MAQWHYSLITDKLTATLQVAKRVYSLAQEQHDSALMMGAYRTLAVTLYFSGDFETAQQNAMRGVQIWRSRGVQFPVEEVMSPVVVCLCYGALYQWHLGEVPSCQADIAKAISLAKELNDIYALGHALWSAGSLGHFERNPAEVDCLASDLIELSAHHNFVHWLALGAIFRGWARSASGNPAEGIPWIEQGIRDFRATSTVLGLPSQLARKAEEPAETNCRTLQTASAGACGPLGKLSRAL